MYKLQLKQLVHSVLGYLIEIRNYFDNKHSASTKAVWRLVQSRWLFSKKIFEFRQPKNWRGIIYRIFKPKRATYRFPAGAGADSEVAEPRTV